jgi:hypothetical protein
LISALRILKWFFLQQGFFLHEVECGLGDERSYFVFGNGTLEITFSYVPEFDIVIREKTFFKQKEINLAKLKEKHPLFSDLPDNYEGEDGLSALLEKYLPFIKTIITEYKNKKKSNVIIVKI